MLKKPFLNLIVTIFLFLPAHLLAEDGTQFSDYPEYLYFQRYTLTENLYLWNDDLASLKPQDLPEGTLVVFIDRLENEQDIWYKLVAEVQGNSIFGWVKRQDLALDNRQFYGKNVIEAVEQDRIDSLQNSFEIAKAREYALSKEGNVFTRNGFILKIGQGEAALLYENDLTVGDHYTLWDINEEYIVLHDQYYEGRSFLVISKGTDDVLNIIGEPRFQGNMIYGFGSFYTELPRLEIYRTDQEGFTSLLNQTIYQPTGFRLKEADYSDPQDISLVLELPGHEMEYTIQIKPLNEGFQVVYPSAYSPDNQLVVYAIVPPEDDNYTVYLDGFKDRNLFPVMEFPRVLSAGYEFKSVQWQSNNLCLITFRKGWSTKEFRLQLTEDDQGEEFWILSEI